MCFVTKLANILNFKVNFENSNFFKASDFEVVKNNRYPIRNLVFYRMKCLFLLAMFFNCVSQLCA